MEGYIHNPLASDLNEILKNTLVLWEEFRGKRLFITGGTGFFGRWFLESFVWANEKLNLNASVLVLTRNSASFKKKVPHLAVYPALQFHPGDVRDFEFPHGQFSHIIHAAATSAVATFNNEDPLIKFDTLVQGTRRVLDFAVACKAQKILYTSSGVVYGKQPAEMTHIPEDYDGAPDPMDVKSAWGHSKRAAEFLCAYYAQKYALEIKIARCFSFVGPFLPLDIHYAIGNFMRDALSGGAIHIKGDGTPYRSYLYASDLMIWLWTILCRGGSVRPYNVGSEQAVTIAQLARNVASYSTSPVDVVIARSPAPDGPPPERYVPATQRAQTELGLKQIVTLEEAIKRTLATIQIN
jgi:dTDP-glucose 4,6-dehydratase